MESLVIRQGKHAIIEQDIACVIQELGNSVNRLQGKRLLITGGTGFIGTWLLETISWLNKRWSQPCKVYVLTRNPDAFSHKMPHLASQSGIIFLLGDVTTFEYPDDRCDIIVHAAAPADPQTLIRDPLGVAETIVRGTQRVLELATHKAVEKFLFLSSGAVYGIQPPNLKRIPEDYVGGPNLESSRSCYGEAKRYAEVLCAIYREKFGVPILIARLFTFLGPYQDLNAGFAVTDFIRAGLQGLPIHVKDGESVRSYYYAANCVTVLWKILLEGTTTRAYNVGSDEATSIMELAHQVVVALGKSLDIIVSHDPIPGQLPTRYVPNTNRIKSEFGITMNTDLKTALERTILWMQDTQCKGEFYE